MHDLIFQSRFLIAKFASLPQWVVVLGACGVVVIGAFIGRRFWRQFKEQAVMVELETRRAQSEFDLVSRDVIKIKQEVTADLAARNLKI